MMDEPTKQFQYTPAEIGRHVAALRERAGKKQAEVAKEAGLSPTVLSRAESGERPLPYEELFTVLRCIGTEECLEAMFALDVTWEVLPRPPLGDSALRELWAAEEVAQALRAAGEHADQDVDRSQAAVESRRLVLFQGEVQRAAARVAQRHYQVAFIGPVGAGKSTAICGLTGLQVDVGEGLLQPVLDAGPGRTTVCEVRLRRAPEFGVLVDPYSEDDLRQEVQLFAEYLIARSRPNSAGTAAGAEGDGETMLGVSAEVDRALRNLSGLQHTPVQAPAQPQELVSVATSPSQSRRRLRSAPTVDAAAQLASQFNDPQLLAFEILSRMRLEVRTARQLWYEPSCGLSPQVWLKKTFSEINNGRHPEFSLPRCVHVCVPQPLFEVADLEVSLIDTKGLDGTAARPDLGALLDSEHTLCVLCTSFVGAPHTDLQRFLKLAHALGKADLPRNNAVLVLAKPGEAASMRDPATGSPPLSVDSAYDWKHQQVYAELAKLGIGAENLPLEFYNVSDEGPQVARTMLAEQLTDLRSGYLADLQTVVRGAKQWLEGQQQAQVQEARSRFSRLLLSNWTRYSELPEVGHAQAHAPVVQHVREAHPMRVHAAAVRQGEWWLFSFSYLLALGARQMAQEICQPKVNELKSLCIGLVQDKSGFGSAAELIEQVLRTLDARYEDFLRKIQLKGSTLALERLKKDASFWTRCQSRMGRGDGYLATVSSYTGNWFTQVDQMQIEKELYIALEREWAFLLGSIRDLLVDDDPATSVAPSLDRPAVG